MMRLLVSLGSRWPVHRQFPGVFLTLLAWPLLLSISLIVTRPAAADVIEFLSGAKVQGTITKIDKTNRRITIQARIASRQLTRVYPYQKIRAVTYKGKRYVINKKTVDGGTRDGAPSGTRRRTRAAIDKLIDRAGRTAPDWFDDTPLEYPKTLDLAWREPAPGPWDNQKNVGQYIWDIINPNPGRWRGGIRLVHHLLVLHREDPKIRVRAMRTLASMYFRFFQDYARAAFWWRRAGVGKQDPDSVALAECYWRLGNKAMAVDMLNQRILRPQMIKLWGDMGETDKARQLAAAYVRAGGQPHIAYLHAGDACRLAGRYQQAIRYYQQVIDTPIGSHKGRIDLTKKRARASRDAIRLFDLSDPGRVADGTYRASSLGFVDQVHVEVQIRKGKIESVRVTQHQEKQFYSALKDIPQQIIEKQGVKGVDTTSRATVTAEAIINATAKAMASGVE